MPRKGLSWKIKRAKRKAKRAAATQLALVAEVGGDQVNVKEAGEDSKQGRHHSLWEFFARD